VLHAWSEFLVERGVKTVIFDECQELRHPGTRKHEACTALSKAADNVAGLSGTPIYNHGIEMHSVMNTLCRGSLGTRAAFERDWCSTSPASWWSQGSRGARRISCATAG
jgi:SWI/SNF-related matrix-associated actin-dependent regulator 1 of chromatin subfamily A